MMHLDRRFGGPNQGKSRDIVFSHLITSVHGGDQTLSSHGHTASCAARRDRRRSETGHIKLSRAYVGLC
jgi:hypothetical protein